MDNTGQKQITKLLELIYIRHVMHVIADIHVPTHCSTFYNDTFSNGDRYGIEMSILDLDGELTNLHAFWD